MTCLSPVNSSVWLCLMDHKNDFIVELDYGCLCLVLWAINATEMLKPQVLDRGDVRSRCWDRRDCIVAFQNTHSAVCPL